MTSKNKAKGNGFEREIVKQFQDNGLEVKRAWGSNGQSLGLHEEVDVVVSRQLIQTIFVIDNKTVTVKRSLPEFKIQAKRRKKLPKFLGLTEHVDAAVFREDQGDSYILFRLKDFIERFLK